MREFCDRILAGFTRYLFHVSTLVLVICYRPQPRVKGPQISIPSPSLAGNVIHTIFEPLMYRGVFAAVSTRCNALKITVISEQAIPIQMNKTQLWRN